MFISISKAAKYLGVGAAWLGRNPAMFDLHVYYTAGGHRRYSVQELLEVKKRAEVLGIARGNSLPARM